MKSTTMIQAGKELGGLEMVRKVLLLCGILASVLYVGTDILGALSWEGYSYAAQTISELSAIGSPSRPIVTPLFLTFGVLEMAFGLGALGLAGRKGGMRTVGALLVGFGAFCLTGPFTPMNLRENPKSLTDTLHIIGATIDVIFILLIIGFAANGFGRRFLLYSIGTALTLVVFGALAGMDGPQVAANLPTPWVGINERICNYGFWLWQLVLSVLLLRGEVAPGRVDGGDRTVSAELTPARPA
jgi:hypothetical protein